jgi:hypothetical protein
VIAGTVLGALALNLKATAEKDCPRDAEGTPSCKDEATRERYNDAKTRAQTYAYACTPTLVVGGAMVVTGLVVWLTAPKPRPEAANGRPSIIPFFTARAAGLSITSQF